VVFPQQNNGPNSVQTWLSIALQGGLGLYFAYNIWSGNLSNYINERFVWLSYIAVIILFVMTVFAAYRTVRYGSQADTGYSFSAPQRISWSLLFFASIPLIFGVMVPSAPLGAEAVNGGVSTRAVLGTNQSSFTIPPENRNILDWLRMFGSAADMEAFNGQPVNLSGFVYREPVFDDDQFMVSRFTVSCCVADASAIGLPVQYDGAIELTVGIWVQIQGRMEVGEFDGDILPIIQTETVELIEQPAHPYLYP
jgi:uncharacterized repeat protein (TIGR03943 family)